MREEYFPAVHKGETRVGQVTDLMLLRGQNVFVGEDLKPEFFWHVGWDAGSGEPRVDDAKVERKFKAFKADVKRIGTYEEIAAWHKDDEA